MSLDRIKELLGVDEMLVQHGLNSVTVSVRIAATWMAAKVDFSALANGRQDSTAELGRVLYELAADLKRKLNIAEARGEELDRLASIVGIKREPEERRPTSRFEAIAEELKKL